MKIIESFKVHAFIKQINEALDPELRNRLRKDLKKYCDETGKDYSGICTLAGLDTRGYEALSSDVVNYIDEKADGEWSYDESTGKVNVEGGFSAGYSYSGEYSNTTLVLELLKEIRFGKIEGSFRITSVGMTDEIWEPLCPENVEGSLDISSNEIKTVTLPPKVDGSISLNNNAIESLEGCPEEIAGDFSCSENNLTNLEGGPKIVNGDYHCEYQNSTYESTFNLKGCAETIKGSFIAKSNKLKTLEGGPMEVEGRVELSHNELEDLKGNWKKIGGRLDVEQNNLSTLEGIPLGMSTWGIECKGNLMQPKVMKETYNDASEMESWIAAYLKLAATQRFKRMGKKERDPIVAKITPELIAKNPIAMAPIWRDTELLNDPVIKRRIKQSGITKDDAFKKNVNMVADLAELGF